MYKLCKYASELEWSGGRRGWRQLEVSREGEGRSYHDTDMETDASKVREVSLTWMLRERGEFLDRT